MCSTNGSFVVPSVISSCRFAESELAMSTTTFSINLDPAIKPSDYSYVYFVAFDQSGNPVSVNGQTGAGNNVIKLINNGVLSSATSALINQGINQGTSVPSNYFIIMQSSSSAAGDLSATFTTLSTITAANAKSNNYNFTMLEAVLTPSVYDQMDISALNNYGPNVSFQIQGLIPGAISSSGFNASLDKIISSVPAAAVQGFGTKTPLILGPNGNADIWPSSVWKPYLDDLVARPQDAAGVKFQYLFGGSTLNLYKLGIAQPLFSEASSSGNENVLFILQPLFPGLPGSNTNTITMSYSDLQNSIYAPTFSNDPNGFAKSYLVSGFDAGLWGANTTYINPNTTKTAINSTGGVAKVDLSNSWNWGQLYNYNGASAQAQGLATISVSNVLPNATYDKYAGAIAGLGNPYGYTFSDLLSVGGVTPSPNIWTGSQDAANITINVFANSTTPSASSNPESGYNENPTGYLAPEVMPPNGWYYQPASLFVGAGEGNFLQVDTRLAGNYHPDINYPMTFRLYNPTSVKAGSDGFVSYELATTDKSSSPWSNWTINDDFTITNNSSSNLNGFFSIDNIPVAPSNDVAWYQLVIGKVGSPEQTVYDIYSNNSNGSITNFITNPGVDDISISTGGDKLSLAPGLVSSYNPLSYFDYNDLQSAIMYQMVLNRATPDKAGLTYWSDYLMAGGSELKMADAFVRQLAVEQPTLSNKDFVTLLYTQGFGREPEGLGRDWWTEKLDKNQVTRGDVALSFADSHEMWQNATVKGVYSAAGGISTIVDWNF